MMKLWISVFLSLVVSCWSYSDPTQAMFEKIYQHALSATDKIEVQGDLGRIIAAFGSSSASIPLYYLSVSQIYYRLGDTQQALIEVRKEQNLLGRMAAGALLVITGKKIKGNKVLSELAQVYYTKIIQKTNNRKSKLVLASNLVILSKIVGIDDINGLLAVLVKNRELSQDEVAIARDYVSLNRDQILSTMWPQPLH